MNVPARLFSHSVRIVLFCGYYWLQAPVRILLLFRFCDVPCELTTGAKLVVFAALRLFYSGILLRCMSKLFS